MLRVILAIKLGAAFVFTLFKVYFMDMDVASMVRLWKRVNLVNSYVSGAHNKF